MSLSSIGLFLNSNDRSHSLSAYCVPDAALSTAYRVPETSSLPQGSAILGSTSVMSKLRQREVRQLSKMPPLLSACVMVCIQAVRFQGTGF